ncbi:MAG: DUF5058 family protein [Peptococcaceae bacterium]|nr:DUF5058 family protein [Peptococcaceae bacterium]
MMYFDLAGHNLTYAAVIVGIVYILGLAALTMRQAWKRALKIGYTKSQLRKVARVAISHTLIPAVAVLAGFFALAPILGIPLSWWRLSIIGNTSYEIMAANVALNTAGLTETAGAGGDAFILIMYVMAIGIMGGMVIAPLISKGIQKGTFKLRAADRRWGALGGSVYMASILMVFIVPVFFHISVALLTLVTGGVMMAAVKWVTHKFQALWLEDFALVISMLTAMVSSVLWNGLLM